jgi:hypothetical protein
MPNQLLTAVVVSFVVLASAGLDAAAAERAQTRVAQLETKTDAAAAGGAFVDEFDGDELSSSWKVLNPSPDDFIVDDGALLIVSGKLGDYAKDTIQNLFQMTTDPPDGDWVATLRVKLDAQTGKEGFDLLLHDDAQHYVGVGVYTYFECCGSNAVLQAYTYKRVGEETSSFERRIWKSEVPSKVFTESARSMPALLIRLEKRGQSFYPALKLEEPADSEWIELERLVALRAKGRLGMALRQYEEVKGETIATVDWFRLEPTK